MDPGLPDDARAFDYLKTLFEAQGQDQALVLLYRAAGKVQDARSLSNLLTTELKSGKIIKMEHLTQFAEGRKVWSDILSGSRAEGNSGNVFIVTFGSGRRAVYRWNQSGRDDFHYEYEAATYVVDQFLDLDIVPITVVREINGRVGALQTFIPASESALRRGRLVGTSDVVGIPDQSAKVRLLDLIIANRDRNHGNRMFMNQTNYQFAIDHTTRTFAWGRSELEFRYAQLHQNPAAFDPGLRVRLRLANPNVEPLRLGLKDLLSEAQIRALVDEVHFISSVLQP